MADQANQLLLGIDLGSTALKCALFDFAGNLAAETSVEYSLLTPRQKWVEINVETYWTALRKALETLWRDPQVNARDVVSVGISAQGETLVPVDEDGTAIRNAIVWLDNRAEDEARFLQGRFGDDIYVQTGQPTMLATWPAAKLLWLTRHEPEVRERTHKFLLIEDWLIWKLTGEYISEGSLVTSTCYWNPSTKEWWPEMLDAINVGKEQLPTVVEPGSLVGTIRRAAAEDLGLPTTVKICAGALDQACGAIGAGNVTAGQFSENTGAAVALCATVPKMTFDPNRAIPCHYHGVPNTYMMHTFTSGGIVLRWFRDQFCEPQLQSAAQSGGDSYALLGELAATVKPGADGLLLLPHLQGAMAPENNSSASGALIGLTLQHGRGHVLRAIFESVAFIVRRNVDAIEPLGPKIEKVRALGGGARSPIWKQIEADVLGRPVVTMKHSDAGALGAAILGGIGIGAWSDVSEATEHLVVEKQLYEPNPEHKALYEDRYAAYTAAYEALVPTYQHLASSVAN
ncbi:FGGY family carbohydrate kinase [Ensifer sp. Root127]|uniref:xylulokinase n=1 Tax=Ensifer sp. Root127 TaxID=1736440 RepID=UPI000708E647|nr:FGGY family carbohydrate kinase [Ensifer sp. Root127]KQW72436.1 hypothetical protein ASD03_32315 [Ensifer sp. Root127]